MRGGRVGGRRWGDGVGRGGLGGRGGPCWQDDGAASAKGVASRGGRIAFGSIWSAREASDWASTTNAHNHKPRAVAETTMLASLGRPGLIKLSQIAHRRKLKAIRGFAMLVVPITCSTFQNVSKPPSRRNPPTQWRFTALGPRSASAPPSRLFSMSASVSSLQAPSTRSRAPCPFPFVSLSVSSAVYPPCKAWVPCAETSLQLRECTSRAERPWASACKALQRRCCHLRRPDSFAATSSRRPESLEPI